MSELILRACKELIDDAKVGSPDLVFKEVCIDVLSRASHILSDDQFDQLLLYAEERLRERYPLEIVP